MNAPRSDAGFSVIEALVATALLSLVALGALAACRTVAGALAVDTAAIRGATDLDTQTAALRADAASALAVFVPPAMLDGTPNAGAEVDFYARTDAGEPIRWCYRYTPAARTLQRWDYDASGALGVRDGTTGLIDPSAAYPALTGVTTFRAQAIPADRLADADVNRYAGVAGLFSHLPRALPVRYDAGPGSVPTGGNGVVDIEIATDRAARDVHLAAGSMATGFTVTGAPVWHAIVYRVDQSHRFLLGLAGKSHVFINAHVDVSYDHWATRATWCDFNLFGDPDGLDPHDPHADYQPADPSEQSTAILAACRARHPVPPDRGAPGNAPDPDAVHPPLPGQTAPPCWVSPGPGGRCWPADAPVDWTPPAPPPLDTPPPAWCATHERSTVCRADGAAAAGG